MEDNEKKDNREKTDRKEPENFEYNKEDRNNKISEVFKGLGLGLLYELVIFVAMMNYPGRISGWLLPVCIILFLGLIVFFYAKGRRKFGLGLVIALFIPLAIMGGCFLMIFSF